MKKTGFAVIAAVVLAAVVGVYVVFPMVSAADNASIVHKWVSAVETIMEMEYTEAQAEAFQDALRRYTLVFVGSLALLLFVGYLLYRLFSGCVRGEDERGKPLLRQGLRRLYVLTVDKLLHSAVNLLNGSGMLIILRLCAVFLAAVSFWATARGMTDFIFTEEWQAYLASFAIQGMLLGLSFLLPKLWGSGMSRIRRRATALLMPLALVVLCISSGFSYIYISQYIYKDSWHKESMLLVQNVFREELYGTEDYVKAYDRLLEERVNQNLLLLYDEAEQIKAAQDEDFKAAPDFDEERRNYAKDIVQSPMSDVVNAMESALAENASAEDIESAGQTLTRMRQAIETLKTAAEQNYSTAAASYDNAQNNLSSAQDNLRYAQKNGQETEELQKNVERWSARMEEYGDRMDQYLQEQTLASDALNRIAYYEGLLDGTASGSYNSISDSLKNIQKEFFKEEPSAETMIAETTALFDSFESSETYGEKGETVKLLGRMNEFLALLEDYRLTRELSAALEDMHMLSVMQNGSGESAVLESGEWNDALEQLKTVISGMPVQYADELDAESTKKYDRMASTERLNEVIRLYLTEHNAADRAIIYLISPYRGLAILAMVLALFLDVASFTAGVAVEISQERGATALPDAPAGS